MIDTIRFRIKLSKLQQDLVKSRSVETSKFDNLKESVLFKIYRTDLYLGSFDKNINLFLSESNPEYCFLEFSIPKYYYGHNVYLFYTDKLEFALNSINKDLFNFFGDFPSFVDWEIFRLDICYAWKFLNESIAGNVLEVLRSYKISRKKVLNYDTSIMQVGSTYSIKWYLKKPEFYYHDFTNLVHNHREAYAYNTSVVAEGVLRFEVTMRHSHLERIFGRGRITYKDINDGFCIEYLKLYFQKFFHGKSPKFMTSQTVLNKLLNKYNKELALRLYGFYLAFHSLTKTEQKEYLTHMTKTTAWRLQEQLKDAGIGIPSGVKIPPIEFEIPSRYVVNSSNVAIGDSRCD